MGSLSPAGDNSPAQDASPYSSSSLPVTNSPQASSLAVPVREVLAGVPQRRAAQHRRHRASRNAALTTKSGFLAPNKTAVRQQGFSPRQGGAATAPLTAA